MGGTSTSCLSKVAWGIIISSKTSQRQVQRGWSWRIKCCYFGFGLKEGSEGSMLQQGGLTPAVGVGGAIGASFTMVNRGDLTNRNSFSLWMIWVCIKWEKSAYNSGRLRSNSGTLCTQSLWRILHTKRLRTDHHALCWCLVSTCHVVDHSPCIVTWKVLHNSWHRQFYMSCHMDSSPCLMMLTVLYDNKCG